MPHEKTKSPNTIRPNTRRVINTPDFLAVYNIYISYYKTILTESLYIIYYIIQRDCIFIMHNMASFISAPIYSPRRIVRGYCQMLQLYLPPKVLHICKFLYKNIYMLNDNYICLVQLKICTIHRQILQKLSIFLTLVFTICSLKFHYHLPTCSLVM